MSASQKKILRTIYILLLLFIPAKCGFYFLNYQYDLYKAEKKLSLIYPACRTNKDCGYGEYCYQRTGYTEKKEFGGLPVKEQPHHKSLNKLYGTCRIAKEDIAIPENGDTYPFVVSSLSMTWWSANRFCEALGKQLVSLSDYECKHKNGAKCLSRTASDSDADFFNYNKLSPVLLRMCQAYNRGFTSWTTDSSQEYKAYTPDCERGYIYLERKSNTGSIFEGQKSTWPRAVCK